MKIMKKFLAAAVASALIATAAGCGDAEKGSETSSSATGQVTQVIYKAPEEEDTTDEAIEYLKGQIPLYSKFLEKRRAIPLTFEVEYEENGSIIRTGIYVKNKSSIVYSSYDADGYETRMVYKNGMAYEINEKEKTVYYGDYSKDSAKKLVKNSLLKISYSDATSCSFSSGETEYEDVMYDYESISPKEGSTSFYYFDKTTGDVCYIVVGEKVNKVVTLNNEVKESKFEVPSDYEMIDYNEFSDNEESE